MRKLNTAAVVNAGWTALEQHLSRLGIVEIPGVGALLFVYVEDFQSRTVRQVVGQVHRIAVAKAYAIEHLAIIVAGRRTPDDFVLAVAIDVGHADIMVTILIER